MAAEDRTGTGGGRISLPTHIEDTVQLVAALHAEHDRRASFYERCVDRLIAQLGRPRAVAIICAFISVWAAVNIALNHLGVKPFDPAPFPYLQGLLAAFALIMTVLILTGQRREDRLEEQRAQITLELAMVSEQKVAKIIELLEHQRRDNPRFTDRPDPEVAAMAQPADPHAILRAVKDERSELNDA